MDYVVAAANLKAFMCGIEPFTDRPAINQMLAKIVVPEFVARSGVKIDVTESEAQSRNNSDYLGEYCGLYSNLQW